MKFTGRILAAALVLSSFYAGAQKACAASEGSFGSFDASAPQPGVPAPKAPEAVPGPDGSPDMSLWNEYISLHFGGEKAAVSNRGMGMKSAAGSAQALERLKLEDILDANLDTRITFKTSSGDTIHVSGAQAMNCDKGKESCSDNDKYFLMFHSEKGQTLFVRGTEVANAVFMSGKKDISFAGSAEKYTVRLFVKITSPGQSRLKVETQGRMALDISLDQLTAALGDKGKRLKSGSQHNLYYNTEVLQDKNGNGYFGKGRVLVFSPRGSDPNQYVSVSRITAMGVTLDAVEKSLGFRIADGYLEIYKL